MRMKNVKPALLISVPCPICEAAAGNPCVFHSGVLRSEPHLDRKILAADSLETKRTQRVTPEAHSLSSRVMKLFGTMGEDRLNLRVLFEVAGNSVKERLRVIKAIDELVLTGMLEACGEEFYVLTEKAKATLS
jgi:hypothetical protein